MDSYYEELKLTKDHIKNLENQIIELETNLHELSKELQLEGKRFNLLNNITQDIKELSEIDDEYDKNKCKGVQQVKVELMTVNGKRLVYSNVQKIETVQNKMKLHCPDEPIVLITFNKNKIVKLVSYI